MGLILVRRSTKRWLLSPITQIRAHKLVASQRTTLDAETAWVLVRLRKNPAEADYALAASDLPRSSNPGVHYDRWESLSREERNRRTKWLERRGKSPFQLLDLSSHFLTIAGIAVVDWGLPEERQQRA